MYLIEILHQTTTKSGDCVKSRSLYLIEILHQTTTSGAFELFVAPLYLIEILHQTTTSGAFELFVAPLYLIEILHQTTTDGRELAVLQRCILSKFYIKPQHLAVEGVRPSVVSYRNSTSNHNSVLHSFSNLSLYLIEILHQTTTPAMVILLLLCCILSKFYIKPQHLIRRILRLTVVSYRNSTSNHNNVLYNEIRKALYLIEILHQTTTRPPMVDGPVRCILSKFYIKPQRRASY